ncbi:MAG TPA: hypothetical protein VGB94_02690 [Acidobacteriaceae bacterium]
MSEIPSIATSVSASYLELTKAAEVLNGVTDAFGKAVSEIDDALKKLNLGIMAWVKVDEEGADSDDPTYYIEEIGYSKIGGKWGIALRTRVGNLAYGDDDREDVESWLFNEATRTLRLKAIVKLPELVNKLSQEAAKMTNQLQSKLADAQAIAVALNPPKSKGFIVKGLSENHPSVSKMPVLPASVMRESERLSTVVSKEIETAKAAGWIGSAVAAKTPKVSVVGPSTLGGVKK